MSLDVTVVIPVLNQERTLEACLRSLLRQTYPKDRFEVVIVDNNSSDRTREIIRAFPFRYAHEPQRSSYAARNRGVSLARGRVVAFMDSDCEADPRWLEEGVGALERAGVDLLAGRIDIVASPIPNLFEIYDSFKYLDQRRSLRDAGYAVTANFFSRRDVLESLGRFDGNLVSGGDRELCLRAREQGLRIAYEPGATVKHGARSTLRAILAKNERIGYGLGQQLRRRPSQIVSALPMLLFMVPRRRFFRDLFRRKPPCTRFCVLRLFLLDWLAKQYLVLGAIRAAISDSSRTQPPVASAEPSTAENGDLART